MGLVEVAGDAVASGTELERECNARRCGMRLMALVALLVSAAPIEVRASLASLYVAPLVAHGIPSASALSSQTITFVAPSGQTFGAAPFAIVASASSGLPVSFASLTTFVCSVNSATVTLVSAGTCTIQASQSGNATYAPAPTISRAFTVAKANQTISFSAVGNQILGVAPITLSATASSGLIVTFSSLTPSVCTVSATTLTIISGGTCTIRASQVGFTSYFPAPNVDQGLQVTPAIPVASWLLFAPMPVHQVGSSPSAFAVADFNRDGKMDVAVVNQGSRTVSILLGDGQGSFVDAQYLPAGTFANDIVAADFNGDGKVDLAVTSLLDNSVWIFLGNGDGSFKHQIVVSLGAPARSIAAGDFNRDGKVDLVVTNSVGGATWHTVQVLLGNGDGTFQPPVSYIAGTDPFGIAVGDVNQDGILDLIVTNSTSNDFSTLLGIGDGTFRPALTVSVGQARRPGPIAIGDFSGDGRLDVAIANQGLTPATVAIFLGRGDGTYSTASTLGVGTNPAGLAIADLNGDGQLDLIVTNRIDSKLYVFSGVGDGSFQVPQILALPAAPIPVATGDFDGDGKTDLILGDALIFGATVLLNQTSMPAAILPLAGTPQSAATGAPFPIALSTGVRDGANNPLSGRAVTLAAPVSGPSGTFAGGAQGVHAVTAANGVATAPILTANATEGSFSVLAEVAALTTTFALTNGNGATTAPAFTSGSPPSGFLDSPYSFTLTASGVPPPTFAVTAAALPPGLTLSGNSGLINGTPTATGAFAGTFKAANGTLPDAIQTYAITIAGNSQTIGFGALPSKNFGDAPFVVSASASSGLPVSFGSLTILVCSVSGNGVTILGLGACTVQASQGGNATFAPAPSISQTFTVLQGNQSIAFGSLTNLPVGSQPFSVNATASSGLAVTFTSQTVPVCTVAGNTVTLVTTGICTIRASQSGNANYAAAASVDQGFLVMGAIGQTISFGALGSKALGSPPFLVSAVASSALTVAFSSLTPAVCTASSATVTLVAMGTCTVRASQAGNGTYLPAPSVDQDLAVLPTNQSIAFQILVAPTVSLPARDTPLDLRPTSTSGLPVSLASLTPTVCRVDINLLWLLRVGICTVRASQSGDGNFAVAPDVDQTFPVTAAFQSISFWPIGDRFWTDPAIQLSATATSGLPIAFSSLTPSTCSVADSIASPIIGPFFFGSICTLRASQAGSTDFAAVTADQSFTIFSQNAPTPPAPFSSPLIEFSTYLGSASHETAFDIAVGPDGSAYIGGSVARTDFPGLDSATFTNGGLDLLFVAKLGADDAKLSFATVVGGRAAAIKGTGSFAYVGAAQRGDPVYLGGGQVEAMAGDPGGNIYVAAYENSTRFPSSGGTYAQSGPKYIFKIAPSGTVQRFSAPIDPAVSTIRALVVDSNGSVYFTGVAAPGLVTGPNAVIPAVPADTVVAPYLIKLAPGGTTTTFATYLTVRGSRSPGRRTPRNVYQPPLDNETTAYALAVDTSGNTYIAGQANADDFPITPGAAGGTKWTQDTQYRDAFVAKLNPGGTAFVFVARLDGGRSDAERATSIALSPDGGIVIGGKSGANPFFGSGSCFQDEVPNRPHIDADREIGFIAKLFADGSDWQFIAPIGTLGGDLVGEETFSLRGPRPVKVAVDAAGAIYAAGTAFSAAALPVLSNIPGIGVQYTGSSAFVMKLSSDGSRQIYSTILGYGVASGLALDSFGNAYITGYNVNSAAPGGLPAINGSIVTTEESNRSSVFIAKVNDETSPLSLTADRNPAIAGEPVNLVVRLGDRRFVGSVEFRSGPQILGTVSTATGSASLSVTFTAGIQRLSAIFHGNGPFDGSAAPELILVVNQAPSGP